MPNIPTVGGIYVHNNRPYVVKQVNDHHGEYFTVDLVVVNWMHVYHSQATLLNLVRNNEPNMTVSGSDLKCRFVYYGHSEAFKQQQ